MTDTAALLRTDPAEAAARRRVLVVDDDEDFAEGLTAVLELNGYVAMAVFDAPSAERVLDDFAPDMAVLDIRIGRTNGLDLLASLLKRRPGLPCIMATAHAELDTAIKAVKNGAHDYLRKPLRAEDVLTILARCAQTLELREARDAAEAAARHERSMLYDAVESMAEGFALFDTEDRLVLANNRMRTMLPHIGGLLKPGARFEDLVRTSALSGAFPAAEGRIEEFVQERMARHRTPQGPFELTTTDGRLLRIEDRVTADGGLLVLYTDMTARRHVEEALVESESRFKDMVATVPGVVFQLEIPVEGAPVFHYVSPSAVGLMGLDPELVLADSSLWFDLVHPDDRHDMQASLEFSARSQQPWMWEGRMVLASGSAWWCRGAARPRSLANGGTLWNGIILDVTERKELEEQLLQAQRMKVVGQLTGGVAHDFNNLMLSVQLNIESVGNTGKLDAESRKHLADALHSLSSARELTQRLLAFSRKQPLNPEPTALTELVTDVADLIRRTLRETVAVETHFGENLWPAMIDRRQLESALMNLALNSRDAMPSGGRISITTQNVILDEEDTNPYDDLLPGEYVAIAFSDTGAGMPPDVAERAFEPFFTTKEVGEGSGLGLSMVYGFLKQSRGQVMLESQLGEGTIVTLYLPRSHEAGTPAVRKAPERVKQTMPRGDETILVVEDEPSVRAVVVRLLNNLGYRVIEAEDGAEALERYREIGEIDLLFSDIVLPGGMDGTRVAAEIQQRQPGVRILFTSGYAGAAMDRSGRIDDGAQLLSKPYPMKTLAARIREILDTD